MATIEIVLGDFEPGVVRIRHSAAGRAYLRLNGVDGVAEDIALKSDIAGCAEHDEGRVGDYLARWMARSGQSLDEALRQSFRHERLFVVVLKDGRKFVARSTPDTVEGLKALAAGAGRAVPGRGRDTPPAAGRFSPAGLISRWLSPKT